MLLHFANFASAVSEKQKLPVPIRKPKRYCTSVLPRVEDIAEIAHNKVLIAAGVSAAIGQFSKPLTSSILYGNSFDFKAVIQSGGFPSSHSSAVVAVATSLAIERGFSDSIFGMAVVYAGIVMYDSQGVRREVGNHAKTLNKILPKTQVNSIDSRPGTSSSLELESLDTLLSKETNSYRPKNASTLLKPDKRTRQPPMSISEGVEKNASTLKESVGHTEIEVIAGALLGFFVSLALYAVV